MTPKPQKWLLFGRLFNIYIGRHSDLEESDGFSEFYMVLAHKVTLSNYWILMMTNQIRAIWY